ncbi:50S ribosomal protein L9 [Hansschlegelia plantiphila]|uniref:Large ribosomal subunit protein bL9 n=1 Tax=Hansschlegelia plantiphila TaxID=374655 RepID=A0A9W6IYQ3_9HYPH|nr:50S ribosomal protein L9 [Hansschlegelia plantiphila]GLK67591.1 50S ribosomal protein L9 [Hansschlegelia plantiphila]
MQVILLERIPRLGQMGDEVRVKDGYARNFLLPNHKALRANAANRQKFEGQRAQLEARNLEAREEAEALGAKIDGKVLVLVRQAGETGQLYGSVSTRDVAEAMTKDGVAVGRNQVVLNTPIKTIGLHVLPIRLHPEVEVSVTINVARSDAEAARQAEGEDLSQREEGPAFETFSEDDDDRRSRRGGRDDDEQQDAEEPSED